MMHASLKWLLSGSLIVGLSSFMAGARQVEVHDPSMGMDHDTYYVFSTGLGIPFYSSRDLTHWKSDGKVFYSTPKWARRVAPDFNGHLWAPDIVHHQGKYYLYYAASAFGQNTSGIGVAINDTLDPHAKNYHWVDQGVILQSIPFRDEWNAIDPAVSFDDNGTPWLAFGSFWRGLRLVKLDASLTKLAEPQVWYTLARRPSTIIKDGEAEPDGAIEAPFIFHKNGFYYLFVSFDLCCRGMNSTYNIRVGRSENIEGPYVDKAGKSMLKGGGSLVLKGNQDWVALGHNAAYTFHGKDYMVFHAYETADHARQKLRILPIHWKNNWPEVDPADLNRNTTELEP